MAKDPVQHLNELLPQLSTGQLLLLEEMAVAMKTGVSETISDTTDLVVREFADNFSNRLLIHHATHEEKFKKKSFEFAFRSASEAASRSARIVSSQTNPGSDVVVDGQHFSLKTEASRGIKAGSITISKLMEARWIRDCDTQEDFRREVASKVIAHLDEYERILMLRGFDHSEDSVRYDLVEIPVDTLRSVRHLAAEDFKPKSQRSGGSRADVHADGSRAFSLVLDGSVEKITVSNLSIDACHVHASWTVPLLNRR